MADTFTTRIGARKADPTDNVDVNAHINANSDLWDLNIGFRVCTSSTRPSTPWQGLQIFETDTAKTYFWNGSAWKQNMVDGAAFSMSSILTFTAAPALSDVSATINRASTSNPAIHIKATGDTVDRLVLNADGQMLWGPGGVTSADTNLYRGAANQLKTDDDFVAVGNITAANFTPGAFTSYTPVWASTGTAVSLSNGTITGKWAKFGKFIVGEVILTIGSTTTMGTGSYTITLPSTSSSTSDYYKGCRGTFGGVTRTGMVVIGSSTATFSALFPTVGAGDNSTASGWSQTAPATPVSGDIYRFPFFYESA